MCASNEQAFKQSAYGRAAEYKLHVSTSCSYSYSTVYSYLDGLLRREFDERRASEEKSSDVCKDVIAHDHYAGHDEPAVAVGRAYALATYRYVT